MSLDIGNAHKAALDLKPLRQVPPDKSAATEDNDSLRFRSSRFWIK